MKHKKAEAAGMGIAMVAIAIVVGVALIPVLTSLIDDAQVIQTVRTRNTTNTAFNQTITLANDDVVAGTIVILNATGLGGTNRSDRLTATDAIGEYRVDLRLGQITFINRTGQWNITYDYEPDTYVDSATGRTVVLLITLLYAVGLIVAIVVGIGLIRK